MSAAADDLDPVLQYSGTVNDSGLADYPFTATIDCSTGTCLLSALATDDTGRALSLTGPSPVALVNGTVSTTIDAVGDVCGDDFVSAGPLTATASGTTLTGSRSGSGSAEVDCGDGSTEQYGPFDAPFTATLVSGDVCFLTNDCPTATPTPTPEPSVSAIAIPISDGGSTAITASTPGTFSTLATVLDSLRPANVLWATAFTVVLVILVALPTHLLNSAVEKGHEKLSAARDKPATKPFAGWPLAAAGVLAASLISSFVDPNFGFNAASPRVFLSILVSFLIDAVLGWFLVIWLVRRSQKDAVATFTFAPATLLIVAAAVVFSRVTGFQPGIVFGLVAGVSFGAVLAAQKARVTLTGLAYGFGAAVVGWIGYSLLVASEDNSFVAVFAQETLSAMAIGGIAALPIALIPLRGLAGYEVFSWNRVVWGIAYAIGLFGFFFVLMPMPFSWTGVPLSLGVWITLYLLYALIAVGTWLVVVRPWTKRDSGAGSVDGSAETPVAAGVDSDGLP